VVAETDDGPVAGGVVIAVAPSLCSIVSLGVITLRHVHVVEHEPALDAPIADAERRACQGVPADVGPVRRMYSRVGLDPTRRRPSSEALLRRVRRGESLPRINSLVDVCNWCSLEFQLPYGLYDLDHVDAPITLRLGDPGEHYAGIGKDVVHVDGRLVLADRLGPFGNPSSDSARTMVTLATTRALVIIFAPREMPEGVVTRAVDLTAARVRTFADGDIERQDIV
jgi:DNA/RNA-binding domain of Phe-tRNA-synthetase-like protein